jgi:hypothetical protein
VARQLLFEINNSRRRLCKSAQQIGRVYVAFSAFGSRIASQAVNFAMGVDTEDGLHEFVDGGGAGKRLNPLPHKAATHQMHDSGLVVALCGQAGVNSDAAFVRQDKASVEIFPILPFPPPEY